MLMDNEEKLVELFMDNVIWGNIVIDISNWSSDGKSLISTGELFGDWIRTHRTNKKLSDNKISKLYDFFTVGRFVNAVNGKLQDRENENIVKQLNQDNEKLVNIVAEQKAKIDENIRTATDTKNIRGIE